MTIDVLKESGAAQMLQSVRHQVDSRLQKRIRFVIKTWQKLIVPNSGVTTVIPAQHKSSANGGGGVSSNDNNSKTPFNGLAKPASSNSPLIQKYNGHAKSHRSQSSLPTTNNHGHQDSPIILPTKRLKSSDSFSYPANTAQPSPLSNGHSPKVPIQENGRLSSVTTAPKLSKVKSTAELIQEAGLSIDPAIKDRILSNRIAKESDEVVHVAPLASIRTSRKPRVQKQQQEKQPEEQQKQYQLQSKSRKRNTETHVSPKSTSVTILPTVKEEPRQNSSKPPPIPPIKLDRIHSLLKQDSSDVNQESSDHNHRFHKENQKEFGLNEDTEREEKKPLPNFMDNIPPLPPVTKEMRDQLSYRSCKTPDQRELSDIGKVGDLIHGMWEEVNATRDEEGNLRPMTEMCSVPINDEEVLHILPWTNLSGYRQTFFPPGFDTAEDIDRLMNLPEPW
nr:Mediator of RNA polymerase II transcription [Hymenolepis microstoma]